MFREDLTEEELRKAVRITNNFNFLSDTMATILRSSLVYWGIFVIVSAITKDLGGNYNIVAALLGYTLTTLKELRYSGKFWLFTKKEYGQAILSSIGFLLYNTFLATCLIVAFKWAISVYG